MHHTAPRATMRLSKQLAPKMGTILRGTRMALRRRLTHPRPGATNTPLPLLPIVAQASLHRSSHPSTPSAERLVPAPPTIGKTNPRNRNRIAPGTQMQPTPQAIIIPLINRM